ncbi:hypothetical protein DEA8626_02839 [Defluviimonas aquaemixtae]|uniref:Adenosylcobalamin/alpha-ribazole phosphatase n=1 Tax=Albidovulum aquaemixtae TaxID=1542388 RepID=A0A2R8BKE6_9RHOB|nr:histidine phosphatase family protein [Defluviimonas aquaemixtae]SPH23770.1 hypothetical protein DEA8626_02839 [Defluviimonas aquaemixtae]
MSGGSATELMLIRHAPALHGGRLCGRTDVAADCSDMAAIAALRARLGEPARIVVSPARRCRETAAALWPDVQAVAEEPDLWEQDFGAWEGRPFAGLPDLGLLSSEDLAQHRPPEGESFADLCARAMPVLTRLAESNGPAAVVVHGGTVRAGLAIALGAVAPALAFDVAPLSVTRILALPSGAWSIASVNEVAA